MTTETQQFKISSTASPGWRCQICEGFYMQMSIEKAPGWFWRKMQHLILGFKWEFVA